MERTGEQREDDRMSVQLERFIAVFLEGVGGGRMVAVPGPSRYAISGKQDHRVSDND